MNKNYVFVQCEVSVFLQDRYLFSLGGGISAVCKFSKLADEGIQGVIKVSSSYHCNRDVYISGMMLVKFIETEYPQYAEVAREKIKDLEGTYKIVCYDMS